MQVPHAGTRRVPPCRSYLRLPADGDGLFQAAQRSAADAVVFDLGTPDPARRILADAIGDLDWAGKTLALRIHDHGPCGLAQVAELLRRVGGRIDTLIVPGVETVEQAGTILRILNAATPVDPAPVVELQLDTQAGLANAGLLAAMPKTGRALHCLAPPYPAAPARTADGSLHRRGAQRWRDAWLCAVPLLVGRSAANDARPIDAQTDDGLDAHDFAAVTATLVELGFRGKWTGDPERVSLCNAAFTPPADAVERALAVLAACDAADQDTLPAVILDGRVVDAATIWRAKDIVATSGIASGSFR